METVEELFETLVDEFVSRPGVTPPGSTGRFGLADEAYRFVRTTL
ncbi:hypothetical protein [Pseudonocardia sp.]